MTMSVGSDSRTRMMRTPTTTARVNQASHAIMSSDCAFLGSPNETGKRPVYAEKWSVSDGDSKLTAGQGGPENGERYCYFERFTPSFESRSKLRNGQAGP